MKKLMTIMLAAALVCAVAGQASAAALETSGELRARGWYLNNYFMTGKSTEFWDQRLRLNMDWAVAEGVKIHARADIYEGFWGEGLSSATHSVSGADIGSLVVSENVAQPWEAKQQIIFDHVNMIFTWPGTPLTFTIGRQDVSWGTGYDTQADNRDRFKVSGKFGDIAVALAYDKNKEVFLGHATKDDSRAWSVGVVIPAGTFKVGVLGAYAIDATGRPAAPDAKFVKGNAWVMGKAGMVDVKAEATYLTGDNGTKAADGSKAKRTGLGAYAGVSVPLGPVTLGVEGAYAQGDDPKTAKNEGGFSADYQGPFWSVIFYQNQDYPGLALDAQTSNPATDFSVKNAMAAQVSATMPNLGVKGLTLVAKALMASADKVKAGSKAMGTELDLVLIYAITDNVALTLGGGYAILGDYWKGKIGAAAGSKPDNPLGTKVAFAVKF